IGCLGLTSSANADIKIRQIHPDDMGMFSSGDWVELQLTGDNETTAGLYLTTYDPGGSVKTDYLIPSNPPVSQSQRTFLITNGGTVGAGGVTPDLNAGLTSSLDMTGQDGAACLTGAPPTRPPVDCVAYGNFTGTIPSAGTPAAQTAFGDTLERK